MTKRLENEFSSKLAWASFIGSILIVNGHSTTYSYTVDGVGFWNSLVKYIHYMSIPVMSYFFFVSGFLFFFNYIHDNLFKKWKSRIHTLLIPYILWNFLTFIVRKIVIFQRSNELTFSVKEFLESFILHGNKTPVDGVLWYVFILMGFVILAPQIHTILQNKKIGFISVLVLIGFNFYLKPSYYSFLYWAPVYCMGAYIGLNFAEKLQKLKVDTKINSTIISIISLATYFVFNSVMTKLTLQSDILLYIYRLFGWMVIFVFLIFIRFPEPSSIIRGSSFFIYASQVIVLYITPPIIKKLIPSTLFNGALLVQAILMLVATVGLSLIFYMAMKRFTPQLLNLLTGSR